MECLLSLHLKATMMKVSDPIMFGHAVRVYYKAVFDKHAAVFDKLGVEPNNGIGDVYAKIQELPQRSAKRSSRTFKRSTRYNRPLRWWTPTRASRTFMCRAT
jgi:monomeric isocitrate dehydrogenase